MNDITWKKFHPLTDKNAYICLVDHMGDDSSIVQAARVSYGKDEQEETSEDFRLLKARELYGDNVTKVVLSDLYGYLSLYKSDNNHITLKAEDAHYKDIYFADKVLPKKDRALIRYLLNHGHTTPFEMVEIKFMVQVPMDCWRQWIRHRTASVNEYSTRYTEAIDAFQITDPKEWRLQATNNKQGSSGYLRETGNKGQPPYDGQTLSHEEQVFHSQARELYEDRLRAGVAKEQARKDLPLSTYTRAYWKCDLHNIFNFLRLRMDSHAQLEIRQFANSMYEIVKEICPVACEAFEDYVLHAKKFSHMEMETLQQLYKDAMPIGMDKPSSMSDREWKEFLGKLS